MVSLGEVFGFSKAKTRAPDVLAQENLLTQITPTGTLRVGSIDRAGEFVPGEQIAATRIEETPFTQQFREGSEALSLGLLKDVTPSLPGGPGAPTTGVSGPLQFDFSSSIAPRSAEAIRGIVPSAQGTTANLPSIRSTSSISGALSPFVTPDQFGGEISRLEDATFEAVKRRLDPGFRLQEQRLIQNLADRGIPRDSRAGQRELEQLRETENEALTRASFDAVSAGRSEQERLSRLGLATRGQQFGEQIGLGEFERGTRGQLFEESRSVLSDSLQKQIQLSQLESQQRQDELNEQLQRADLTLTQRQQIIAEQSLLREQTISDRSRALSEVGGILGLSTGFEGNIFATGAGSEAEANRLAAGQAQIQRIGDVASTVASVAGGGF